MSTTFYPALLCGALGRPRWAYSFLGGIVVSLVVGDGLEDLLKAWVVGRMQGAGERSSAPGNGEDGD